MNSQSPKSGKSARKSANNGATRDVSKTKNPTSFRLSGTALELLALLADDMGISQASVIEQALRDLAKQRGVNASDVK